MKFFQISDIHIHNFTRHEQYRSAFSIFYNRIEEEKPDAIVITGDIAHNKTELSPEFVELCSEFLLNCSKRVDRVDIIIGNHDCNVKNKNRQNAISPIVDIINKLDVANVTLFEKSGIYDINENFRYAVYSILDDVAPNINSSEKATIALFHGIVDSAITDLDFSLSSNFKLDYFKGCDFGFFGDIHRRQKLDPNGRFRYPGSFIQQNIGESLDKGFLIWNIADKNTFSVSEENIYIDGLLCSITLNDDLSIKDSTKILDKSYIRVYHNSTIDKKKLHEYIAELYKKYQAIEVKPIKKIVDKKSESSKSKIDFSLEKYLENKDEKLKDKIVEIDRNIETKIDAGLLANRGLIWDIKEIEFSNLFAYGEDNKIDFTKLEGIVGILGENRIGKSSIIDVILWTLFNECSKKQKKASWIVHIGANEGKSKITIETNTNETYIIERKITLGKKKDSSLTSVNFIRIFSGIETSLNGIDRVETDKNIRSIFGSFESFIMTSLAPSGMMNNFVKNVESERLNILSTFLGSDVYKAKNKLAKEESEELKTLIKSYKNVDFEKDIFEAKSEIAIVETKIDHNEKKLAECKSDSESIISKIHDLRSRIIKDVEYIDITDVMNKKEILIKEKDSINAKLDDEYKNQGEALGKIFVEKDKFLSITLDSSIESRFGSLQKAVESFNFALRDVSNQERLLRSSTEILNSVKCDRSDCIFIKDAISKKHQLDEICKVKAEREASIKKLVDEKVVLEKAYNEYSLNKIKKEKADKDLKNLHTLYKDSEIAVLKLSEKLKSKDDEIIKLESKLIEANNKLDAIKNNRTIEEELKTEDKNLFLIKKEICELESKIKELTISLGASKSKLESSIDNKFSFFESKRKYDAYEKYLELTGRTGIPLEIIVENLDMINNEIHNILIENSFDFEVSLEENEDKSGIELFMKRGEQKYHLENESSSEEAISSIALRLALINICTLPRMSSFILDEAFGSFDSKLLPKFEAIFEYVQKSFKRVVIISHIDKIKDLCNRTIDIERKDKESKVSV